MNTLRLLTPGYFLDERAVQIVLSSFASLYHQLTPKHQRRLRLYLVEEPSFFHLVKAYSQQHSIAEAIEPINRMDIDRVEQVYQASDFFIYLSEQNQYRIITEALRYDLPAMVLKSEIVTDLLDNTCSMLLEQGMENDLVAQCTRQLDMLYFDREVCKYLKKGAIRKRAVIFGRSGAPI